MGDLPRVSAERCATQGLKPTKHHMGCRFVHELFSATATASRHRTGWFWWRGWAEYMEQLMQATPPCTLTARAARSEGRNQVKEKF